MSSDKIQDLPELQVVGSIKSYKDESQDLSELSELSVIGTIKPTYWSLYWHWALGFIILLVISISIAVPIVIAKHANIYKADWAANRCKLHIMPIAGYIQKDENETVLESTEKNFQYCLGNSFNKTMNLQMNPLLDIQNILNEGISAVNTVLEDVVILANASLSEITSIFQGGVNNVEDIAVILYYGFILVYDIFRKILMSLFSTLQFSLTGMTWGTLFIRMLYTSVMNLIVLFYAITVVPTIPFWIFIFPLVYFILFTFLLVISEQFKSWIFIIIDAVASAEPFTTMKQTPKLSLCFDKNTMIKTKKGLLKIYKLKPGTILCNGDIVTAVFKTVAPSKMFNLNGIIVSGDHYVYRGKWIKVKHHPESVEIEYSAKYLYCFNTSSKRIFIDDLYQEQMFMDWDELPDSTIQKIVKYLNATNAGAIQQLDKGFIRNFPIKMLSGYKKISRVLPGDILNGGIRVMAVVRMNKKNSRLYHLVTDAGYIKNTRSFKDYNFIIDKLFYMC